ncbi:hypothetical protein YC2023_083775 [Brassica napus]
MVSSPCDYTTSNGLSIPDNSHVNVNRISIDTAPGQREKEMRRITSLYGRISLLKRPTKQSHTFIASLSFSTVGGYKRRGRAAWLSRNKNDTFVDAVAEDRLEGSLGAVQRLLRGGRALDLIDHLRAMGETNALLHRNKACFSFFLSSILNRETALATAAIYDSMFATEDGTIPATFQVIYMTGWREHSSHPQAKRRGSATVSFTDIQKQFGAYS